MTGSFLSGYPTDPPAPPLKSIEPDPFDFPRADLSDLARELEKLLRLTKPGPKGTPREYASSAAAGEDWAIKLSRNIAWTMIACEGLAYQIAGPPILGRGVCSVGIGPYADVDVERLALSIALTRDSLGDLLTELDMPPNRDPMPCEMVRPGVKSGPYGNHYVFGKDALARPFEIDESRSRDLAEHLDVILAALRGSAPSEAETEEATSEPERESAEAKPPGAHPRAEEPSSPPVADDDSANPHDPPHVERDRFLVAAYKEGLMEKEIVAQAKEKGWKVSRSSIWAARRRAGVKANRRPRRA